jgi:hypothetical protein
MPKGHVHAHLALSLTERNVQLSLVIAFSNIREP